LRPGTPSKFTAKEKVVQKEKIMDLGLDGLKGLMEDWGESAYRNKQVVEWLYDKRALSFDAMTNLSKGLRARLEERFCVRTLQIGEALTSEDGSVKFLFRLQDNEAVEGVYLPDEKTRTLCVSSQVGCKFNCAFCLTGKMGFVRDLSSSEIIEQVLAAQEWLGPEKKLTNLVLMGMGEPLDNYDAVILALRTVNSPVGLKFGGRKITLSTVGLLPGMERFQKEGIRINLAVSLNAMDDATRSKIMPVNRKYPLEDLLKFCGKYPLQPGRRITFEYVLIPGINDSDEDARKLSKVLHGIRCKVNLIPLNPAKEIPFPAGSPEGVDRFHKILLDAGLTVFSRKSRGRDIMAACGQLGGKGRVRETPSL